MKSFTDSLQILPSRAFPSAIATDSAEDLFFWCFRNLLPAYALAPTENRQGCWTRLEGKGASTDTGTPVG